MDTNRSFGRVLTIQADIQDDREERDKVRERQQNERDQMYQEKYIMSQRAKLKAISNASRPVTTNMKRTRVKKKRGASNKSDLQTRGSMMEVHSNITSPIRAFYEDTAPQKEKEVRKAKNTRVGSHRRKLHYILSYERGK